MEICAWREKSTCKQDSVVQTTTPSPSAQKTGGVPGPPSQQTQTQPWTNLLMTHYGFSYGLWTINPLPRIPPNTVSPSVSFMSDWHKCPQKPHHNKCFSGSFNCTWKLLPLFLCCSGNIDLPMQMDTILELHLSDDIHEEWSPERLSGLSRVTQLVSSFVGLEFKSSNLLQCFSKWTMLSSFN